MSASAAYLMSSEEASAQLDLDASTILDDALTSDASSSTSSTTVDLFSDTSSSSGSTTGTTGTVLDYTV